MVKRAFPALLVLLFAVSPAFCFDFDVSGIQPLPPDGVFSTFGATTIGKGTVAFSLGVETSKDPDFFRFSGRFAVGIAEDKEVLLNVPYVYQWDGNVDGLEDVAVGFKHQVFDGGKFGPALAYLVTASLPNGKDEFTTGGEVGAGLILSKRVGPVLGHLNLLYLHPGNDLKEALNFAAGIDFAASHDLRLLGEIFARKGHYADSVEDVELRMGCRFMTKENFYTSLAVGTDLKKREPEVRIMLSLTKHLPGEKKVIRKVYEEEK